MTASATHLIVIPSYNTGDKLEETVRSALAAWSPVWLVLDGSTDNSAERVRAIAHPGLRVIALPANRGKGGAVLAALEQARAEGFTHALTMDADGQHPVDRIAPFMVASQEAPQAMILGMPVFDASAPAIRVHGRKLSRWLAGIHTRWTWTGDPLCGFRVYPIADLLAAMAETAWMRRFDFDPEAAVRLSWRGVPAIDLPVRVRYFRPEEGGVSHFRYLRDNLLLIGMNARLLVESFRRHRRRA
ncbi:glycosyltransferase family 2 protein [Marinivivus vitaminiproducens]|uniref:glycosyltransferase family 2 protein n=1 Tax=Marinivivus vitaminiproducens TaxID=3035935 RepID=UPI00279F48C0|nr:glycosyltransferase family 2 protein [Geminicoccaceae bacterium SCSIO 64248]